MAYIILIHCFQLLENRDAVPACMVIHAWLMRRQMILAPKMQLQDWQSKFELTRSHINLKALDQFLTP